MRDGLKSWCNACNATATKAYQKAHPDRIRATALAYKKSHPEKIKQWAKTTRLNHLEEKRAIDRQYAAAHREEFRQRAAAWYAANKERAAKTNRAYREKFSETIRRIKSAYDKSHRIENNMREQKRKAKKRGNGGTYTKVEFIQLCQKYGNRCLMCQRDDVKLTADHVVPIFLGGSNYIENIQPLCVSCNSKKHTTILDLR